MKKTLLKLFVLILVSALLLPFLTACGEDGGKAGTTEEESAPTEPEVTTPAPTTPEPTTPEPTEPPTTLEPIDPSLPYYEQLAIEFSRFGLIGGDMLVADDEAGFIGKIEASGATRKDVDITGEKVPFTKAINISVTEESVNFWDRQIVTKFKDTEIIKEGELFAGCFYVRDAGGPNPSQIYTAVKTPTNDYNGEGNMNVQLIELEPGEGWKKIYFHGSFMVDEEKASAAGFNIFYGYPPHSFDIGGLYFVRYPATDENIAAMDNMPFN